MNRREVIFAATAAFVSMFAGCGTGAEAADAPASGAAPAAVPLSWSQQFSTEFSIASVDFSEVIAGGPPKDGIPAIDRPEFVPLEDAAAWLDGREPVLVVPWPPDSPDRRTRIYPLQILTWHEIVNDRIAGEPIAVTYCPLCNTGIVFDSRARGQELGFGVSGMLRYSNMIMYDRQTESWWQQATGEAIAGRLTGERLRIVPSLTLSFEDARKGFPEAAVLSRQTGHARPYGTNPYEGYDSLERPFLYRGPEVDRAWSPLEQVVVVMVGGESRAVPYAVLREEGVVQFALGGRSVAVFWKAGTASALDSRSIARGRDTGSANAFLAHAGAQSLQFESTARGFRDTRTGTLWSEVGTAVEGPLKGERLPLLTAVQHFWFSYSAFADALAAPAAGSAERPQGGD